MAGPGLAHCRVVMPGWGALCSVPLCRGRGQRSALADLMARAGCPSPPLATLRSGLIFITVVYAPFELSLVSLSSFALKSPRFYSAGKFIVPYIRAQPQTFKVTPILGSC